MTKLASPIERAEPEILLRLTVQGEPVAWKRIVPARGHPYLHPETRAAEEALAWEAKAKLPADYVPVTTPVALTVHFHVRHNPKGGRRKDLTNLLKLLEDAWNGVVWRDDGQIVQLHASRHDKSDNPRTEIVVHEL